MNAFLPFQFSLRSISNCLPGRYNWIFAFLFFLPCLTFAQEVQDTSDRVHIDHADSVHGIFINGHEYKYLRGNVALSQDSVFLYCDSAQVIDDREVRAIGNIIIQKGDSLEVYADTLLYFADTRQADLKGEVALVHGEQQLWTRHLKYDLNLNVATYNTPGQLIRGQTQLSSRRGVYFADSKEALFVDSVIVIDEEFNMLSDSLRYNAETQLARFIAPTWIFQDSAQIYCEEGFYDLGEKKAEFRKNAVYTKGNQRAWATVITYDGETRVVTLSGDAHFEEGEKRASGDVLTYNEKTGEMEIIGNGEFHDGSQNVTAEEITYNRTTGSIGTKGRSRITKGSQILDSDASGFNQKTGRGEMHGNVVISDTSAQTVLISEHAEFVDSTGYMKLYGNTRPLMKVVIDADTMYVAVDTLVSYEVTDTVTQDTLRRMLGYHDVRIFRGTMQGLCDSLSFGGQDSIFTMFGNPILWSDTTQFTGDTIDLHIRKKALAAVVLRTNGLIVSVVKQIFYNQIKGRRIHAVIEENEIQRMHVEGNAESIYYAQDDDNAFLGVNQVASSEIVFTFLDNQIDQIKFTTRPSGTMTPMHQVNHQSLRLDGFIWRDQVRPRQLQDLF